MLIKIESNIFIAWMLSQDKKSSENVEPYVTTLSIPCIIKCTFCSRPNTMSVFTNMLKKMKKDRQH